MVEPTFMDIWDRNNLPNTVFVVGFTPYEDVNISVNGLHLPTFSDRGPYGLIDKAVNMSEKNKDWLPFFISMKAANNFFDFLAESLNIVNPRIQAGLIFNPLYNTISVYCQDLKLDLYHVLILGNFSLTNRKLRAVIRKIPDIRYVPTKKLDLKINDPELPSDIKTPEGALRNWSTDLSSSGFTDEMFELVRKMFSKMYGHTVSKLVVLH